MLGEEALRLLRENWPNPTMLAQELYVMLSSPDIPITTSAPITYTAPSAQATEAAITLAVAPDQPAISIPSPVGPGGITIGPDGINMNGGVILNQGIPPTNGPAGMPGTIQGPCGCPAAAMAMHENKRLLAENASLRQQVEAHARRIAFQTELVAKRAEKL